jgi:hypothetical protein
MRVGEYSIVVGRGILFFYLSHVMFMLLPQLVVTVVLRTVIG